VELTAIEKYFTEEKLKQYFSKELISRKAVGVDSISTNKFSKNLDENLKFINRKLKAGTYKFSPYRMELLTKTIDKTRKICVSTVRDNLVLYAIKEYLNDFIKKYNKDFFEGKSVQKIIFGINEALSLKEYKYFVKLDIQSFYDNIEHEKLLQILQEKNIDDSILTLITKAIKNQKKLNNEIVEENYMGVPQGIPIANLLANIYLENFDKYNQNKSYKYFRYVDDILILCNSEEECKEIQHKLYRKLKMEYYLEINNEKTQIGSLDKEVNYIGYRFSNNKISVRKKSVLKIEKSLEELFKKYVYQYRDSGRQALFVWYLNIRITGAICNGKKYGWLFFFSQIDDLELLFHLDYFVNKLMKRFKIEKDFEQAKIKKFVRTYNEIRRNLDQTQYIPDIDAYTIEDKIYFLKEIVKIKVPTEQLLIEKEFNKVIFTTLKDLEKDLQRLS